MLLRRARYRLDSLRDICRLAVALMCVGGCDTHHLHAFVASPLSTDSEDTKSVLNVDTERDSDSDDDSAWYPCNGSTEGYNATAVKEGDTWTVQNGGVTLYTGMDMETAMREAYASLSENRTEKESVLVLGSGDVDADSQIRIPSNTILNVCGVINVTGSGTGDKSPLFARFATNIDVPNVTVTGTPNYGLFFRETDNVHLGRVVLELDAAAWLGMRIDHSSSAAPGKPMNRNYQIDYAHVIGSGGHGIEIYGITDIRFGEVIVENIGGCGLIMNYTTFAQVDSITATNCDMGRENGAVCLANQAGNVDDDGTYPQGNIHLGEVTIRAGGRGIFSIYDSGGVTIDTIDIANTGSTAILLQDAHRFTIAEKSGTIAGPFDFRIAGASDNIAVKNLVFQDSAMNENPCGTNVSYANLTFDNSQDNSCQ